MREHIDTLSSMRAEDMDGTSGRGPDYRNPGEGSGESDAPVDAIVLPDSLSEWTLTDELRRAEAAMGIAPPERQASDRWYRVDAAHETPGRWKSAASGKQRRRSPGREGETRWLAGSVVMVLLLGLAGFTVGGTLLAIAFLHEDFQLWNTGMPIALAGAMVTLFGLVLQLDRLWQENRENVARMSSRPDEWPSVYHGETGSTHRADAAEEPSPMALLADLRRQIDLLAERLQQELR